MNWSRTFQTPSDTAPDRCWLWDRLKAAMIHHLRQMRAPQLRVGTIEEHREIRGGRLQLIADSGCQQDDGETVSRPQLHGYPTDPRRLHSEVRCFFPSRPH